MAQKQVFSCEYYEIFEISFFTEHLRWLLLPTAAMTLTLYIRNSFYYRTGEQFYSRITINMFIMDIFDYLSSSKNNTVAWFYAFSSKIKGKKKFCLNARNIKNVVSAKSVRLLKTKRGEKFLDWSEKYLVTLISWWCWSHAFSHLLSLSLAMKSFGLVHFFFFVGAS